MAELTECPNCRKRMSIDGNLCGVCTRAARQAAKARGNGQVKKHKPWWRKKK